MGKWNVHKFQNLHWYNCLSFCMMPIALDNVFEAALLSNAHTLRISNEVLTFRRNSVFIQSSLRNLPSDERIVMPTYTVSSVCEHTCAARLNCNNHCTVNNIYQTHLLINLRSPRDCPSSGWVGRRSRLYVLDRKLLERLMSPSPKSQVMFASAFS